MAEHDLNDEFQTTHQRVSLGDRALVAIAAHVEVRSILRADGQLRRHGLEDVLIGSYARWVSIWPGKDVDVFGRLTTENVGSIIPDTAYAMFGTALQTYADQGRLTPQPRSFKVDFGPSRVPDEQYIRAAATEYRWESRRVQRVLDRLGQLAFAFSVDVVPAVAWGDHFGIPEIGRHASTGERYRTGQWRLTNPVELTRLTQVRNRAPRIGGVGAYVRTVEVGEAGEGAPPARHQALGAVLRVHPLRRLHRRNDHRCVMGRHHCIGPGLHRRPAPRPRRTPGLRPGATRAVPAAAICERPRDREHRVRRRRPRRSAPRCAPTPAARLPSSGARSSAATGSRTMCSRSRPAVGARARRWAQPPPTSPPAAPPRGPSVTDEPPFDEAAEPERLRRFLDELEAAGFERVGPSSWEGPTRQSLIDDGHTDSERMTIIIRPSWPYLSPLLHVPGISAWHADQERLCIWQAEDSSQRWATLHGIHERIDEWSPARPRRLRHHRERAEPRDLLAGRVRTSRRTGRHRRPHRGAAPPTETTTSSTSPRPSPPTSRPSPIVVFDLERGAFRLTSRSADGRAQPPDRSRSMVVPRIGSAAAAHHR